MKLLIIRPGALGDTLLMLPVLAELKGKATVLFAGRQPGLAHMNHAVSRAMDLETAGWHWLFSDHPGSPRPWRLPISSADKIIAFFKDRGGIILQNLEGFFPDTPLRVFPSFPPRGKKIHVARYLAGCLESAGLPVNGRAVMDNAFKRPLISGPWTGKMRNRVVFHPGSGGLEKNHPPGFWLNIFKRCMGMDRFARLKPALLLGPAEAPLQTFFRNCEDPGCPPEILFCPGKEQLLNILASAALYLGHDSGITHLSGLMGTPTVALFKHSDPVQWRPLGPRVHIIHREKADLELLQLIAAAINAMAPADG